MGRLGQDCCKLEPLTRRLEELGCAQAALVFACPTPIPFGFDSFMAEIAFSSSWAHNCTLPFPPALLCHHVTVTPRPGLRET